MEIQDFILKPEREEEREEEKKETTRKKSTVSYAVAIENECDFVINRTTSRGESSLVVIVSQTPYQAYIKKGDKIELLDGIIYARFMSECDDEGILFSKVTWIERLEKGKPFGDKLLNYLKQNAEAAKVGVSEFTPAFSNNASTSNSFEALFRNNDKIAFSIRDTIKNHYGTCKRLAKTAQLNFYDYNALLFIDALFGLDQTRKLIQETVSRGLKFASAVALQRLYVEFFSLSEELEEEVARIYYRDYQEGAVEWKKFFMSVSNKLDFKTFLEYALSYEREGFETMDYFFNEWADDLIMQKLIFGKIKEKYPQNLKSHHARLSVKRKLIRYSFNEEELKKVAEDYDTLNMRMGEFLFIVPNTSEMLATEAIQQNNCLRSYISKMAEGKCIIVFLRIAKRPDDSWITIEVSSGGQIVQIKGRNNKEPGAKAMEAIDKWAEKCELEVAV